MYVHVCFSDFIFTQLHVYVNLPYCPKYFMCFFYEYIYIFIYIYEYLSNHFDPVNRSHYNHCQSPAADGMLKYFVQEHKA